jgi:hypothetical protein
MGNMLGKCGENVVKWWENMGKMWGNGGKTAGKMVSDVLDILFLDAEYDVKLKLVSRRGMYVEKMMPTFPQHGQVHNTCRRA